MDEDPSEGGSITEVGAGGGKDVGGGAGGGSVEEARGRKPRTVGVTEILLEETVGVTTLAEEAAYGCGDGDGEVPLSGVGGNERLLFGKDILEENAVPIASASSTSSSTSRSCLVVSEECRGVPSCSRLVNDGFAAESASDTCDELDVCEGDEDRVDSVEAEMEKVYVELGEYDGIGMLYMTLRIPIRFAYVSCFDHEYQDRNCRKRYNSRLPVTVVLLPLVPLHFSACHFAYDC